MSEDTHTYDLSKLLNLEQFYDVLKKKGCELSSPQAIYALTHARKIRHIKIGRRLYFKEEWADEYIASLKIIEVAPIERNSQHGPRYTIPPKVIDHKKEDDDSGDSGE